MLKMFKTWLQQLEEDLVRWLDDWARQAEARRLGAHGWISWMPPEGWHGPRLQPTEISYCLGWLEGAEPAVQPYLICENEMGKLEMPFNGQRVQAIEVMTYCWDLIKERRQQRRHFWRNRDV